MLLASMFQQRETKLLMEQGRRNKKRRGIAPPCRYAVLQPQKLALLGIKSKKRILKIKQSHLLRKDTATLVAPPMDEKQEGYPDGYPSCLYLGAYFDRNA